MRDEKINKKVGTNNKQCKFDTEWDTTDEHAFFFTKIEVVCENYIQCYVGTEMKKKKRYQLFPEKISEGVVQLNNKDYQKNK